MEHPSGPRSGRHPKSRAHDGVGHGVVVETVTAAIVSEICIIIIGLMVIVNVHVSF